MLTRTPVCSSTWTVIKAETMTGLPFDGASFYMDYGSGNRNYYYQIEGSHWANASFGLHMKPCKQNSGAVDIMLVPGNIEQFRREEVLPMFYLKTAIR